MTCEIMTELPVSSLPWMQNTRIAGIGPDTALYPFYYIFIFRHKIIKQIYMTVYKCLR